MKCSICNKRMKSIFFDGKDYSYLQCDTCLEEICQDCCDVDDDGNCECIDCIQTRVIREQQLGVI